MIEKRTKRITVRFTPTEYEQHLSLFKNAKSGNTKYEKSDFIRDCVFKKELPKNLKIIRTKTPSPCKKQRLQMLISTVNDIHSISISLVALRTNHNINFDLDTQLLKLSAIENTLKAELS